MHTFGYPERMFAPQLSLVDQDYVIPVHEFRRVQYRNICSSYDHNQSCRFMRPRVRRTKQSDPNN